MRESTVSHVATQVRKDINPVVDGCTVCESDLSTLRSSLLPAHDANEGTVAIADLFSGCGGLSLGLQRAAHELGVLLDVRLAVDFDRTAMDVYRQLFPTATSICKPIEQLLDGDIGSNPTASESALVRRVGRLDILVGGPPCQGHSNLNNHSRRDDPRNGLYLFMARAAEIFIPSAILIENVPTVTHDVRRSVHLCIDNLKDIGYDVGQQIIDLSNLGVPQKRRRHVIVAVRDCNISPHSLISSLETPICNHTPRSVRWAIADLEQSGKTNLFNSPSKPNTVNESRINWLFDNDKLDLPNRLRPPCHQTEHSYTAMYGRMSWDSPAQTITTGFNCIGQGRYVHPAQRRVITPHEAARLQMLPDFVDFGQVQTRRALAKMIGNAAPPPLSYAIGRALMSILIDSQEMNQAENALVKELVGRGI